MVSADNLKVRTIAEGLGFTEGPVILQNGTIAVTSLTHGCVYLIDSSGTRILAETDAAANGATEASDGALYVTHFCGGTAKQGTPSTGGVLRVDPTGAVEWLTKDPISPNDLCFGPDGYLYVTDPTRPRRQDGRIWRCDIHARTAELLVSVPWHPNGIGFGLRDDQMFVASTHSKEMVVFPLTRDGLGEPRLFCKIPSGRPDGFAFDEEGNLLVAAPAESPDEQSYIHIFDTEGRAIEAFAPIPSPRFSNLALGTDGLMIVTDVAHESVLSIEGWPVKGMALHPFR
jgi:gluconolactonase